MKIACEACGAKYTIADDKVRGRKVKIRCKGCGTPIVVDGQQGGGPSLPGVEADAALDAEAPVVWSVNLSDTDSRTMSVEEIVQGYASGLVTADAFVWKDGMADWVAILESELAPLLAGGNVENLPSVPAPEPDPAPGIEPVAAAPGGFPAAANSPRATMPLFTAPNQATGAARPAATRAQSQPDNTQDLFGGIDAAGADEEEVATSAPIIPQAGATAYGDGNMTGARNENSVLFSLDALKAGFSPSAPAAKPAAIAPKAPSGGGRPQQPSNPDDPFGMGASAGLMGVGGGGALFGGNNQALLTAPAPPPPPVAPSPVLMTAGAMPMAAPRQNNKLVLIVGAIGGVVIIGLILALVLGRTHDETPSAEGSASPSAGAAPSALAEVKKDEPAAKPEETPAASATAAPAESASAAPDTAKTSDKPPTAVAVAVASKTPTPTTDAKKKKEDPIPPGASDAPAFSKSSAISALTAASMSAGACKKPGGPTGSGKATVTFAPSGRVTTATVSGAFAGTPVGGCVASGFRKAHVPAFSGSAVTVSKSFTIN
ncbi:MAG TPA: zinc-ribbon domain-containing protein [Polyangiaceae bacterium]